MSTNIWGSKIYSSYIFEHLAHAPKPPLSASISIALDIYEFDTKNNILLEKILLSVD